MVSGIDEFAYVEAVLHGTGVHLSDPELTSSLRRRLLAGVRLYQHVAGVIGGIGLLAIIRTLTDLDLHGVIATVTGFWDHYIRQPIGWPIDQLVALLGLPFTVPVLLKDYIAVGVIFCLSLYRNTVGGWWPGRFRGRLRAEELKFLGYLAGVFVIWPLLAAFCLLWLCLVVWAGEEEEIPRADLALILSPLFYLAVLLILNLLIKLLA